MPVDKNSNEKEVHFSLSVIKKLGIVLKIYLCSITLYLRVNKS